MLVFGGDADAGVDDVEVESVFEFIGVDEDGDFAFVGEFDGVADEVDEDLFEAHIVGNDVFWDGVLEGGDESDAFFVGADFQQVVNGSESLCGGNGFELDVEFVGVHFGEVEDIIEEGEEVAAVALDGLGGFLDDFGIFGFGDNFCVAEDGGEGGAEFVAHVGEELGLGAVGVEGGLSFGFDFLVLVFEVEVVVFEDLGEVVEFFGAEFDFLFDAGVGLSLLGAVDGDFAHFFAAVEAGIDEEDVLEDDPGGVFEGAADGGGCDAVDGLRIVDAAEEVVGCDDDGGGDDDGPVAVEGEEGE